MQVFSKNIGAIKQFWCIYLSFIQLYRNFLNFWLHLCKFYIKIRKTRPARADFKTAEEGRAKICKFLWQKLKNKSNIEKHIMNNFITLLEQF